MSASGMTERGQLLARYSPTQQRIVDEYIRVLSGTRKARKIAESVLVKEMQYWNQFPSAIVIEALRIHIHKYPEKKESYTRGIIRTLNREKGAASGGTEANNPARGSYGQGKYKGHYIDGAGAGKLPF